jgi:serine/threonine protein kinase
MPEKVVNNSLRRLESVCGQGNFGWVYYKAQQILLGESLRSVAVKVLDREVHSLAEQKQHFADALLVMRLLDEAGTSPAARHVVTVFDLGVDPELGNRPYVVMEYLTRDLATEIGNHGIGVGVKRSAALLEGILLGLSLLHGSAKPIMHLDLHTGNVLLDGRGGLKVADFGLATDDRVARARGALACQAPESG